MNHIKSRGIGGMILWEIGGGYLGKNNFPTYSGQRDELLQAVKQTVGSSTQICTPGTIQSGTCLVCNSQGTGYNPDNLKCPSEQTCNAQGQCTSTTQYTLSVTKSGTGTGTVASSPAGINCGADCLKTYSSGTTVTLTATASAGSTFTSLSGCDSSTGNTCTVTMNSAKGVTVTFSSSGQVSNDLLIYQDSLLSPWTDSSYTSTRDFASTEQIYSGTNSIKIIHGAWGALAFSNNNDINPTSYSGVGFAVYGGASGLILDVRLRNNIGGIFPRVRTQNIPANTWQIINLSMSQLNSNSNTIANTLSIEERSGVEKTFYVDEIKFTG